MQGGYFKTKKVHIFVNGDAHPKSFYIHPRCRLGWNAILDCFSRTFKPYFGAIRVLRTVDGRRIIEDFSELQHEGKYVACGLEAFRNIKGGYLLPSEIRSKMKLAEYYPAEILGPDERKKYPCLIETMKRGRTLFYVFANGKRSVLKKVVLIKSDYEAWDIILTHIGNILDIPEGVRRLYTVFGQPLCSPHEIQHGGYYVAIPFNASFKQIKYLMSQRSHGCHECSPMITKEVYISAAKTCTIFDGVTRKRRKLKRTKIKDHYSEKADETEADLQHHVRIEGIAIKRKDRNEDRSNFLKKRGTGHPGNLLKVLDEMKKNESSDHSISISSDDEPDFQENEVHITNYYLKEMYTQTTAPFLEAVYDKKNAIYFKLGKYYVVPEKEFLKLGDVDASNWYTELLPNLNTEPLIEYNEEDRREIESIADTMVGVIIQISEKIANRTVYGRSGSNVSRVSEQLSRLSDTLELQTTSQEQNLEEPPPNGKEKLASITSKDKSLRLSIPIGRTSRIHNQEEGDQELSKTSCISTISMESWDKEFKPLTPSHTLSSNPEEVMVLKTIANQRPSKLLKNLRKDSIGLPTDLELEYISELTSMLPNDETIVEDEDEWRKLDILDDIEIMEDAESDEDMELLLLDEEEIEDDIVEHFSDEYSSLDNEEGGEEYAEDADIPEYDIWDTESEYDQDKRNDLEEGIELEEGENLVYNESDQNISSQRTINTQLENQTMHSNDAIEKELIGTEINEENNENKINNVYVDQIEAADIGIKPEEMYFDKDADAGHVKSDVDDIISILPPAVHLVEEMFGRKSHDVPLEFNIIGEHIEFNKPPSFGGLEDRRITLNTWDQSIERVLKEQFVDEIPKLGDQHVDTHINQSENGEQTENSSENDIERERRSLVNFLRSRIELALNDNLAELTDNSI